jgi:hypothetical protein
MKVEKARNTLAHVAAAANTGLAGFAVFQELLHHKM